MTLDKYIDLSTIKGHINDYKVIDNCPLDLNLDIYNPDTVLKFMEEKCNFDRTKVKKIRDIEFSLIFELLYMIERKVITYFIRI